MSIKYLILSDLHLGEEDSLLTNLKPGVDEIDPLKPSPVLTKFAACLEELISPETKKPYLVVLGDGLEMALAHFNQAAMAFERLVEELFLKRQLFKGLIYVPGNHDHHLWETAREVQYSSYLARKISPGSKFPEPWHISNAFPTKDYHYVPSPFIAKFLGRFDLLKDFFVGMVYPVFGLLAKEDRRIICMHHGHLIESIYRLMSKLRVMLFPEEKEPKTLDQIEKENFAWIDFFWSTMGRSGPAGKKIESIYERLLVPATFKDLIKRLANVLAKNFDIPLVPERWEDEVFEKILQKLTERKFLPERRMTEKNLSPHTEKELRWFVEGPLLEEIKKVLPVDEEELAQYEFNFIFGHTHKPFARLDKFYPYRFWTKVLNTGGWIVDRLELLPIYGANLVLINDTYEIVNIELFRLGSYERPRVSRVKSPDEGLSSFEKEIAKRLEPKIWQEFVEIVQAAAQVRVSHLRERIFSS